jgi:hypothetical protein
MRSGNQATKYAVRHALAVLCNDLQLKKEHCIAPRRTAPRKATREPCPTVNVTPSRNGLPAPLYVTPTLSKWIRSPRARSVAGLGIITRGSCSTASTSRASRYVRWNPWRSRFSLKRPPFLLVSTPQRSSSLEFESVPHGAVKTMNKLTSSVATWPCATCGYVSFVD